MSLMGSIYVGTSGLQTSSNALNTSAHNLSNVQTEGYTRQQILQGTKFYNTIGNASISDMQVGIGVDYTKCRQVRDVFLDASYREENGRSSFYEICAESTKEIETLLGEMEGASFKESLSNLWTSIEELQKDPSSSITQGVFVTTCAQFLERAQAVATGLNSYQNNLNSRVSGMVKDVNSIADQINTLNKKITKNEIGIEEANDLRDERNYLLDKLSSYVKIKVVESANGAVEVYVEGNPIVIGDTVNHLEVKENDYGMYDVTWGKMYDNMPLYDNHREIASEYDTDIGELRAILLARGDHSANYSDLEQGQDVYNKGGRFDNDIPVANSIVMNAQAEFDSLVHNITTAINNVITDYAEKAGDTNSIEVFTRLGTDRYDSTTAGSPYVVEDYSKSPSDVSTMYTTMNLKVNSDLIKQPTLNSFLNDDKSVDYEKANKLAELFAGEGTVKNLNTGTEETAAKAINPNQNSKLGFLSFYDGIVGNMASVGSVYNSIVSSQEATVKQIEDSRQQVVGVSSEEELQNIIKFQNAYNASSRYINVINEMLEHIINTL